MTGPDAPFPATPPDITPIDVLIERLGDEAQQRGEALLASAEVRAARVLGAAEARAETALLGGLALAFGAWLLLRK